MSYEGFDMLPDGLQTIPNESERILLGFGHPEDIAVVGLELY